MTQAKLAAAARISQSYLAHLESGRRGSADFVVYSRVATRLDVRIEDLTVEAD